MTRQYWRASNLLNPVPAVMVSCADKEGRANVMTAAWAGTICSDPVGLCFNSQRALFISNHQRYKRVRDQFNNGFSSQGN